MGAKPWYDWVFRWRRAWDSNPRTVFGRQTISSRSRYDLFDSPPYISTVFRALRKCKKNTQEQYEILKFDPAKTLINQGFSAEKTARANAHFESFQPLWLLWFFRIAFRLFCPPKTIAVSRYFGIHPWKSLIFQGVRMKAKNEPILAVLLEFALEMLERC